MNCTVVESRAKSRIGTTKATFYYEEKLGFVKYEYVNIDGSSLTIELVEINVNQPTRWIPTVKYYFSNKSLFHPVTL